MITQKFIESSGATATKLYLEYANLAKSLQEIERLHKKLDPHFQRDSTITSPEFFSLDEENFISDQEMAMGEDGDVTNFLNEVNQLNQSLHQNQSRVFNLLRKCGWVGGEVRE